MSPIIPSLAVGAKGAGRDGDWGWKCPWQEDFPCRAGIARDSIQIKDDFLSAIQRLLSFSRRHELGSWRMVHRGGPRQRYRIGAASSRRRCFSPCSRPGLLPRRSCRYRAAVAVGRTDAGDEGRRRSGLRDARWDLLPACVVRQRDGRNQRRRHYAAVPMTSPGSARASAAALPGAPETEAFSGQTAGKNFCRKPVDGPARSG